MDDFEEENTGEGKGGLGEGCGEGRGDSGEGRWWWGWVIYLIIAKVLHTYRQTYRPSDEAGPRGAFAPKKMDTKRLQLQYLLTDECSISTIFLTDCNALNEKYLKGQCRYFDQGVQR